MGNILSGGGGGIRTPETLSGLTVFKTAGFNRSPTPPFLIIACNKHLAGSLMTFPRDDCCVTNCHNVLQCGFFELRFIVCVYNAA
jgi:hypothetical protein